MTVSELQHMAGPPGPLKDAHVEDISSNDFVEPRGVVVQVAAFASGVTSGTLVVRTLAGDADMTFSDLEVGDFPNVCGVPLVVTAVRSSSDAESVLVGYL